MRVLYVHRVFHVPECVFLFHDYAELKKTNGNSVFPNTNCQQNVTNMQFFCYVSMFLVLLCVLFVFLSVLPVSLGAFDVFLCMFLVFLTVSLEVIKSARRGQHT